MSSSSLAEVVIQRLQEHATDLALASARRCARYELEVPTIFSWKDENRIQYQGTGVTRDMSSKGIFLFSANCPPVGSRVSLDVFLSWHSALVPPLHAQGKGRVLRVERGVEGEGQNGFAVRGDGFVLDVTPLGSQAPSHFSV